LKFIALGAEELALLGSRAYIKAHGAELQASELVFNMDCIGGNQNIIIDMRDGIANIPEVKG
jgi:Zn-dependent M28 family amino/carboxypeptidase